ncbi:dihydrofolate reductase [Rhizobium laguerreae]|uniref:dihydrofolate reductase n=1 Tax=Rhizobium laguerreae TaxID=1076926 RepID=UPI001C8FF56F|nr:dihydrofolate reductase [Rhizobium laguerreae]MBY3151206.1 dihydrofolate reductase [Rhizobium laguerreae]
MNLTLMAAADLEWGIGAAGALPWHVPEDLKHFKARTMGKTVVMGRRTVDTLPSSLPGRRILTLTRHPRGSDETHLPGLLGHVAGTEDEVIVAGGGEVYSLLLPYCTRAEITRIKGVYPCDTHLVDLSKHGWTLIGSEPLSEISNIEQWTRA